MSRLPDLVIGDLKIYPPIVQGAMGVRISLSKLASAVANEGAIGTIAAVFTSGIVKRFSNDQFIRADISELTKYIREAKKLTKGVIAANVMVALDDYAELVQTAAAEGVDIIFSGAGLPMNMPKLVKGSKVKIIPIVSSGRAAEIICKNWIKKYDYIPDAIVVEGPLAGGHLGYSIEQLTDKSKTPKLEDIVVDVLEVAKQYNTSMKKIPVIAGGGLFDGKDIARMLKLGASGVQIATRFVCTYECDAADAFKQAYINAKEEDIIIIKSPVGLPGRAINNEFLRKSERGEIKFNCYYHCLRTCKPQESPYCIADALLNAAAGDLDNGFVFAGSNVYRVNKMTSVKELIRELVQEAEANY